MADQPEPPANGAPPEELQQLQQKQPSFSSSRYGSKRQRRPSVRLGEIGEQPAAAIPLESYIRRCKQFNYPVPTHLVPAPSGGSGKASKTRALTNLVSEEGGEMGDERGSGGADEARRGPRDGKARRLGGAPAVRRARTNWVPKVEEGVGGVEDGGGAGDDDWDSHEFEWGDSGSPLKDHSLSDRMGGRARVGESKGAGTVGVAEVDGPSDSGGGWFNGRRAGGGHGGVYSWLNGLGLGRYAPVFEIHEVDMEILPMLTLEDLKEMGINTVGPRRKLFSAIQKLGRRGH